MSENQYGGGDRPESYQINIVNISWNTENMMKSRRAAEDLPHGMVFDVPKSVLEQANKPGNVFNDVIESYVYNVLTRKFGYELNRCQIYLPL